MFIWPFFIEKVQKKFFSFKKIQNSKIEVKLKLDL